MSEYDNLGVPASPVTETEEQKERRLEREARNDCLGVLRDEDATDSACVEVTYQREGDVEHCGHLYVHVHVPTLGEDASEDEQMAWHPATIADIRVHAWAEPKGFEYFSIDEIRSM